MAPRAVRAAAVRKSKREAEGVRANGPNGFPLSSKTKHVFPIGDRANTHTRSHAIAHTRITFVQNGSGSSQNNGTLAAEPPRVVYAAIFSSVTKVPASHCLAEQPKQRLC